MKERRGGRELEEKMSKGKGRHKNGQLANKTEKWTTPEFPPAEKRSLRGKGRSKNKIRNKLTGIACSLKYARCDSEEAVTPRASVAALGVGCAGIGRLPLLGRGREGAEGRREKRLRFLVGSEGISGGEKGGRREGNLLQERVGEKVNLLVIVCVE